MLIFKKNNNKLMLVWQLYQDAESLRNLRSSVYGQKQQAQLLEEFVFLNTHPFKAIAFKNSQLNDQDFKRNIFITKFLLNQP